MSVNKHIYKKLLALTIAVGVVFLDQFSKKLVLGHFFDNPIIKSLIINPYLSINLVFNKGVSFGLLSEQVSKAFLIYLTGGIVIFLLVLFFKTHQFTKSLAIAMIIGGATGNIIDRLLIGSVVDFIDLHINNFYWPAFNVADSFICLGAFLFLLEAKGCKDQKN